MRSSSDASTRTGFAAKRGDQRVRGMKGTIEDVALLEPDRGDPHQDPSTAASDFVDLVRFARLQNVRSPFCSAFWQEGCLPTVASLDMFIVSASTTCFVLVAGTPPKDGWGNG